MKWTNKKRWAKKCNSEIWLDFRYILCLGHLDCLDKQLCSSALQENVLIFCLQTAMSGFWQSAFLKADSDCSAVVNIHRAFGLLSSIRTQIAWTSDAIRHLKMHDHNFHKKSMRSKSFIEITSDETMMKKVVKRRRLMKIHRKCISHCFQKKWVIA